MGRELSQLIIRKPKLVGKDKRKDKRKDKYMSKYNSLWEYVQSKGNQSFILTFEEIQDITGIPINHSFLKYKKELGEYGYEVGKISMKEKTVTFNKID